MWYLGSSENSAHNPFARRILDGTSHKRLDSAPRGTVRCDSHCGASAFRVGLLKTLAIILPIFGVAMILLIAVAPDPRAEEFVWGKKIACASLGNVVGEMAICC